MLRTPRKNAERIKIRMQEQIRILNSDESLDGSSVERDPVLQNAVQLARRDGNVLQ